METKKKIKRYIIISLIVAILLYFGYFLITCIHYYWATDYDIETDSASYNKTSDWVDVSYISINTNKGLFSTSQELEVYYIENGVQKHMVTSDCKINIKINPEVSRLRSISKNTIYESKYTPKPRNEWWFKYLPPEESFSKYFYDKEILYEYEGSPITPK